MLSEENALLRAIFSMTARQAISVDLVREIVGTGDKQIRAFNMCNGSKTQGQIAKATKISRGNFSNTVSRWVQAGIVLRLGEGRETTLLHVYSLPPKSVKRRSDKK